MNRLKVKIEYYTRTSVILVDTVAHRPAYQVLDTHQPFKNRPNIPSDAHMINIGLQLWNQGA